MPYQWPYQLPFKGTQHDLHTCYSDKMLRTRLIFPHHQLIQNILKIESDDGLLRIDYSILSRYSLWYPPDIPEEIKNLSGFLGLPKLDLRMIMFVSWYDPPKTPLLKNLFFGNILIMSEKVSSNAYPLKPNIPLFSFS